MVSLHTINTFFPLFFAFKILSLKNACSSAGKVNGDFSIIKVPSQTLSNRVKTGSTSSTTITGTYSSPPEGALLYKYGKTTKQSLVEVTGVNITWTIDGKKTKGLTKAIISSGDSDGGDSGGPYRHNNKFCGVHKGSQVSGTKKYVYFTPYSYIKNAGFTAKTN